MFRVEIRKQEEILLKNNFQQSDYPLVNIIFFTDKTEVLRIIRSKTSDQKEQITKGKALVEITLPEGSLMKITGELPFSSQKLSLPVRSIITEIIQCSCTPKYKGVYLKTKVTELLIQLLSTASQVTVSAWTEREKLAFVNLKELIGQNLKKNYSIAELADIAGMNRTKMQAGFKALFGTTIYAYTLDIKMLKARELLNAERGISLKEIAALLGYKHSHHFSAAFKKKFSFSPSLFKKGFL